MAGFYSSFFLNLLLSVFLLAGIPGCSEPTEQKDRPPNILVLIADDLGYTDLGAWGGEIATPNLDDLARSGTRLTAFYTSPTCSPTRAMLLSGVDHHRAGLGTMAGEWDENQKGQPGYEGFMTNRVVSVAELLKQAGYHTAFTGKWHLGREEEQGPHRRGFDRSFVLLQGGASHFSDATGLVRGARGAYRENGMEVELSDNFYSTRFYTDRLIEYIREGLSGERPFFAIAAYTAPHWPLQVPDEDLDRYRGQYDEGYDVLRQKRLEEAKKQGVVSAPLREAAKPASVPDWETLPGKEQRRQARAMEIYAAMVDRLDFHIGRLIDFLKETDQLDNTFIVFLSDNGAEGSPIDRLADNAVWIPEQFDTSLVNMGRINSYVYYGAGWAVAGTTPFNRYKSFVYEGGIRVPCVVNWRGNNREGSIQPVFATVLDLAPTFLDLAGVSLPDTLYRGRRVYPMEGVSLLPFLRGEQPAVHPPGFAMGWELFGRQAIRQGDWKMVWQGPPHGEGRWQLFNLAEDPAEQQDRYGEYPAKTDSLLRLWEKYVQTNGIILPTRDMGYAN